MNEAWPKHANNANETKGAHQGEKTYGVVFSRGHGVVDDSKIPQAAISTEAIVQKYSECRMCRMVALL